MNHNMIRVALLALLVLLAALAVPANAAIQYIVGKAGQLIMYGLSSDTKPAVFDGAIFIETDTSKHFRRESSAWVEKLNDSYALPGASGVDTANSPNAGEFVRFTDADTIEGRTEAELKADVNLEIGTDLQAYSANLDEYAAVNPTTPGLAILDDIDAAAQRTTLGLAALATLGTVGSAQIDDDAVTYAKIQTVTDARLLGRSAGSSGDAQEITVGAGLSLAAGSLTATAGGAPADADYLVGTANGSLSAEIVVGASPGGELGGSWAAPTVDDGVTVDAWVMGASSATTPAANDNDTSLATTAFVQSEIDDGDLLTDNCTLENDATPIPDSCVGDGSDAGGAGGPTILGSDATCAVSASYCTIFTVSGGSIAASRGLGIEGVLLVDTDSTTVAAQFRVRSADTGYTGNCRWDLPESATATTTPSSDIVAIGSGPGDTAGTTWFSAAPVPAYFSCALLADASPGDIVIEWQLETGTSPTQTVLRGSKYTLTQ